MEASPGVQLYLKHTHSGASDVLDDVFLQIMKCNSTHCPKYYKLQLYLRLKHTHRVVQLKDSNGAQVFVNVILQILKCISTHQIITSCSSSTQRESNGAQPPKSWH